MDSIDFILAVGIFAIVMAAIVIVLELATVARVKFTFWRLHRQARRQQRQMAQRHVNGLR